MLAFFIAWRYLLTRKKERFISIINAFSVTGIALGVATLIVVMSVMNGYEKEIVNKMLGIQSHITLTPMMNRAIHFNKLQQFLQEGGISHAYTGDEGYVVRDSAIQYRDVAAILAKEPRVVYYAPVIEGKAVIQVKNAISGGVIRGMRAKDVMKKPLLKNAIIEGSWDALHHDANNAKRFNSNVVIGLTLARNMGLKVGDSIKLVVPQTSHTIIGEIPRVKTFYVAGIFDVGRFDYNEMFVFIPFESAEILFHMVNRISYIETTINTLDNIDAVKNDLLHKLSEDWYITDWKTANHELIQALTIERNVMFLILSLIIFIATFNIISSLMILVKDKQKSIAVLRTMGCTKFSIMSIFIICGSIIGITGTVIGGVIGVLFALNIETIKRCLEQFTGLTLFDPMVYFLTTLPSEVCSMQVATIVIVAFTLSILATIYPAIRISGISPTKVLRYE